MEAVWRPNNICKFPWIKSPLYISKLLSSSPVMVLLLLVFPHQCNYWLINSYWLSKAEKKYGWSKALRGKEKGKYIKSEKLSGGGRSFALTPQFSRTQRTWGREDLGLTCGFGGTRAACVRTSVACQAFGHVVMLSIGEAPEQRTAHTALSHLSSHSALRCEADMAGGTF